MEFPRPRSGVEDVIEVSVPETRAGIVQRYLSSPKVQTPLPHKRGSLSSARHTNDSSNPPVKRVRSFAHPVDFPLTSVPDTAHRARAHTVDARTIAARLRGAGTELSVLAVRARYESAPRSGGGVVDGCSLH